MVAPGFPSKLKDPLPAHNPRFHNAMVGAKHVHWEQVSSLSPGDLIYREVERTAIELASIVHVPFFEHLVDFFGVTIPNDAGCTPRKATFWKNESPWPLPMDTVLCGETWIDIVTGPNASLDPGVSGATWDLAREWICLQLNRANGVIPPLSIIQTSIGTAVILKDCDVDAFESAPATAHQDTLGKFNNNDQDGVGFDCFLGTFTGNVLADLQYLVLILFYNHGANEGLFRHVVLTGTVRDEFTDPDNDSRPPEVSLVLRSWDQYVYTLRDVVQPSVDQRPELA